MAESGCLKNVALNSIQADNLVLNSKDIKNIPKTSKNSTVALTMPTNTVKGIGGFFDLRGVKVGTIIKMYLVLSTVGATDGQVAKEKLGVATFSNNTITGATLGTAICEGGAASGADAAKDNMIAAMATVIVNIDAGDSTKAPTKLGVCNFFSSAQLADSTTASHLTGAVARKAGGKVNNTDSHHFLGFSLVSEADANMTKLTAKTVFEVITPDDI